jgi:uncharacterized membrane protein YidH (DUF202 family)
VSRFLALAFVAAGIALLLIGRARYSVSRVRIDEGQFKAATSSVNFSVAVFVVVGIVAAVFVLLIRT